MIGLFGFAINTIHMNQEYASQVILTIILTLVTFAQAEFGFRQLEDIDESIGRIFYI